MGLITSQPATTGTNINRGTIDCSANPNYPAGTNGDGYKVSVAGKIGGASGIAVDVGDVIECLVDNAGGTQASVGSSWFITEHNIVGAVTGPTSATDNAIARYDATTGQLIQNSAVLIDDSNNITTAGSISTGTGGSVAGTVELTQGTAPSLGTTSVKVYAPTSVTSYATVLPSASATGFMLGTDSSNVNTMSFVGFTGTGNVVRVANPNFSANGALSAPSVSFTGTPITGGSTTTTKPLVLIEPGGVTSNNWATGGTYIAVNGATGTLLDLQTSGAVKFRVSSNGDITAAGWGFTNSGELFNATNYNVGNGWIRINSGAGGGIGLGSGHNIAWASGASTNNNTGDTGISRSAAGVVGVGTGAAGSVAGSLAFTKGKLQPLTVGTLGAGVAGDYAYVSDGDASLAWGDTVVNTGAGATKYLVWFNGTNWTVAGK